MHTKRWLFFLLALLLVFPPAVLAVIHYNNLKPFSLYHYGNYLMMATAIAVAYAYFRRFSREELGLGKTNTPRNLGIALLASLLVGGLILLLLISNPLRTLHLPEWNWYYVRYVLLYCPAQEFIYRSLLFAEMNRAKVTNATVQLLISAAVFSFAHILLQDSLTLVFTLIAGLLWGYLYQKQRSFWSLALSHAILGVLSLTTGLL